MKGHILQRVLLFGAVAPLGVLTFVWYLINVIGLFTPVHLAPGLLLPAGGNLGRGKARPWDIHGAPYHYSASPGAHPYRRALPNERVERVGAGPSVGAVFAGHVPAFLMLLHAAAVLTWLVVNACAPARSPVRAIRSELWTLGAFSVAGVCAMLWSILGFFVPVALAADRFARLYLPLFYVLEFVWGWLFVGALCGAWAWELAHARRHWRCEFRLSLATLERQAAHMDTLYTTASNKDWARVSDDVGATSYNSYAAEYPNPYASPEEYTYPHAGPEAYTSPYDTYASHDAHGARDSHEAAPLQPLSPASTQPLSPQHAVTHSGYSAVRR